MTDSFEEQMEREQAAFLERVRTGDLRTVVTALREWSEVESVPGQNDFDLILARLEALTAPWACPNCGFSGERPEHVCMGGTPHTSAAKPAEPK